MVYAGATQVRYRCGLIVNWERYSPTRWCDVVEFGTVFRRTCIGRVFSNVPLGVMRKYKNKVTCISSGVLK